MCPHPFPLNFKVFGFPSLETNNKRHSSNFIYILNNWKSCFLMWYTTYRNQLSQFIFIWWCLGAWLVKVVHCCKWWHSPNRCRTFICRLIDQGPLLLKWFNINLSIGKYLHPSWNVVSSYSPYVNSANVEFWEWIIFLSHTWLGIHTAYRD